MVQVPEVSIVAVVPETVQTEVVVEEKATVRPELAVAERVTWAPANWLVIAGKVMVCAAECTTTLCCTKEAAA
jgi:hypothetical protein